MKHILFFLLLGSMPLFAYIDSDMDGVEDQNDRCPNTAMTELVDIHGCQTKSLVSEHHYDIVFGISYSELDPSSMEKVNTISGSVQADYYYRDFSLQAMTSLYSSDSDDSDRDSGMTDSMIAAYYQLHPSNDLLVRFGAGVILPTYDSDLGNEATDYLASVNISYSIEKVSLFGGYSRTMVNDDDVSYVDINGDNQTIEYQDTNAVSVGAGYYMTPKLYTSLSYYVGDSIYKSVEDVESISVYAFYSLDASRFITATYANGLSDSASDHYLALRIGYYF